MRAVNRIKRFLREVADHLAGQSAVRGELTPAVQAEIKKSAQRGARYLDSVRPGWYRTIRRSKLNQRSIKNCVLGQLYGFYWNIPVELFPDETRVAQGFEVHPGLLGPSVCREAWQALTESWRHEIWLRRSFGTPFPNAAAADDRAGADPWV